MKKYTFGLVIIIFCFLNQLNAQTAIEKAAATSCKCIEEKFDKTKDVAFNEPLVNGCIQEAFIGHIDDFTNEYGMEIISDQKKAYEVGEQLGLEIAKNCPAFLDFSMQVATANETTALQAPDPDQTGEITGKVIRVENQEFVHLIVQTEDGKENDVIWIRYFQGSDQFKGKTQDLEGKNITVTFNETEVYLAKAQSYFKVKEITGIESK
jgi:hypothetical protein